MSTRKTRKTATPTTNEQDYTDLDANVTGLITRFDLEAAIMDCWHTCEDIDLIATEVIEPPTDDASGATDRVANALIGIKELHNLRVSRLFDIFSALIKAGEFKSG